MTNNDKSVQHSISINQDGLSALCAAVDREPLKTGVNNAIDSIFKMHGRLIVTGLGKSGHIGSKLAATFSSTGTPAYFVHPSEASHGDLGMIQSGDVVLLLSWSGETRELTDIASYTRRFGIPLIVITGNADSRLARSADITLTLPKAREACPFNLAPTTSTMLQLVLGDALAVALLERRNFDETSFHNFHPGGKLGASLTAVKDIMHKEDALPLVAPDAPVIDVISELSRCNFGIVGIVDQTRDLVGVVTDGDIRRYLASQAQTSMKTAMNETYAADIMTREPTSLDPDWLSAKALNTLQTRRISAAFVLQSGKPVGLITMLQLLQAGVA